MKLARNVDNRPGDICSGVLDVSGTLTFDFPEATGQRALITICSEMSCQVEEVCDTCSSNARLRNKNPLAFGFFGRSKVKVPLEHHQNVTVCSLGHDQLFMEISFKSIYNFSNCLANKHRHMTSSLGRGEEEQRV